VETCPERVLDVVLGIDLDLLARGRAPIAQAARADCLGCGESLPTLPAEAFLVPLPPGLADRCPRCRQTALAASVSW